MPSRRLTTEEKGYLTKVQVAARTALKTFPAQRVINKQSNPVARTFLTRVGELLREASQASQLSFKDFDAFAVRVGLLAIGVEGGIIGTDPLPRTSCAGACRLEKDQCLAGCGGEGWPCWCCADCRIVFLACVAGCILRGPTWVDDAPIR